MLEAPDWDEYIGERVYDRGKPIGTVVDYDDERGELFLEPSPEIDANTWDGLGWGDHADYDVDWEDVDYDDWQAGQTDVRVDSDVWPCTLPNARLEDGEDGLQLVHLP